MAAEHLTKESFLKKVFDYENNQEWNFKGEKPAIIDFYADWCGPCKMVAPIIEELSEKYEGLVDIYKIDTEAEQELASVFGIRSIPSILFIPVDGQPQMAAGALPKAQFIKLIEEKFEVKAPAWSTPDIIGEIVGGLGLEGNLMVLAATGETFEVSPFSLIMGRKKVSGWPSGTAKDSEDTLNFSAMTGTKPMIETFSLDKANEAYDHMINNKARFRTVLTMGWW